MKKIAMLTTFFSYLESYSLCQCARTQLKMLKKHGYNCRFIFRGGDDSEWRKFTSDIQLIPDFIVDNDGNSADMVKRSGKSMEQLIAETIAALDKVLEGVDVIITHDLIYQSSNNIQDAAASLWAERHPDVLWLHWVHSATSPRDLNKTIRNRYRNAFVVYPNSWDVPRVANNFGFEENQVKVVPHPIDFEEFFGLHPLTVKLIEEKGILGAELLACYPLRLDRGKQPEMCIRILAGAKKLGRSVRLVIIDFQSTGGDKVVYREELKKLVVDLGLNSNEVIFMSEFDPSCCLETPKKVVRDLMWLSNIYIHPSVSETYSLTTQEARACKNLLVLNYQFPAMRSIYGDGPIYKVFGSAMNMLDGTDGSVTAKYNPDVNAYCTDIAKQLLFSLDQAALKGATETRMNKNIYTVFRRYMEPLFFGMARV